MAIFNGGNDDDTFVGGIDPDQVKGGGGNDILFGLNGRDTIEGDTGDDIIDGGADSDLLIGGTGADYISGGTGDFDLIYTGIAEPNGGSWLDRTAERDYASGGSGDDVIYAGYGDTIDGGANTAFGGGDRLVISFLAATSGVVADFRVLQTTPGATVTIGTTTVTGIEYVEFIEGSEFGDTLASYNQSGSFSTSVMGLGGDDTIYGSIQSGNAYGGEGNDTIDYSGASSFADLYGEAGDDVITGASQGTSYGGIGNDRIVSRGGQAHGDDGDDILTDASFSGAVLWGDAGNDTLYAVQRGSFAFGGDGNDLIYLGTSLNQSSGTIGGAGMDRAVLQGDYSAGLSLTSDELSGVETLSLLSAQDNSFGVQPPGSTFSYAITLADDVVAAGTSLTVDASGLGQVETLTLDASAETSASLIVTGGAGNDTLTGGAGADSFFLQKRGVDHVAGGGGADGFYFGNAFSEDDVVDGGAGTDTLALQGNYAGLALTHMTNVELLALLSGSNAQFGDNANNRYSYTIASVDANVAAGQTLTVQASGLLATENLAFDGSAETNGSFAIFAGQGVDALTGGAGSDGFFFGASGNLTDADRIDGGAGTDSVALRGNYQLALQDATFTRVEVLVLLSGHTNEFGGVIVASGYDYDVTLADGNVAAGQTLDVNGANLRADETLRFDGRAETDGAFRILAGAADDSLFGGSGSDTLYGGLGKDALQGGAGADTYQYRSAAESTSTGYDVITGFDWHADRIDAPGSATRSFSQSAQGSLSTASFDADLAAGLDGHLGAGQAALFTASGGTLSGHVFAVIDVNGQAGYQAGQDLVIELANPVLPIDPAAGVIV